METHMEKIHVKNLHQRMNDVMKEKCYVARESRNVAQSYTYASHDKVLGSIRGAIAKHGIVIYPSATMREEKCCWMLDMKIKIVNADDREDFLDFNYSVPCNLRLDKNQRLVFDEKVFGTAYSYAYKYFLLKTFMLETGEDADEREDKEDDENTPVAPVNLTASSKTVVAPAAKTVVAKAVPAPVPITKYSRCVTNEQASLINMLGKKHPDHLAVCLKTLKMKDVKDIPAEFFDRIVESFKLKEEQVNVA